MCSLQPGAHQVTKQAQPAPVSCAAMPGTAGRQPCRWEPGLFGSQHGIPLPEDAFTCTPPASTRLDRPAVLAVHRWVPVVEHCPRLCPIPAAAPSPGCSLALAVPCHVLAQALWPGSVMEEPSFLLVVLPSPPGWARTTSGLCPYLSQHCAVSDCMFGIKSELLLHPLRSRLARSFILAQLRLC